MKRMKTQLVVLAILILSAGICFAGGGKESAGGKTVIEYWSSWSATENQALILQDAAKEFEQLHPDVKINFTFNGRDNRNLVLSAIQAGTQVDIMDANADNIKSLWSEQVADLTPFMNSSYSFTDGKKYVDVVMPSMTLLAKDLFNGVYGYVPYTPQAFMIFSNDSILEECGVEKYPATWDEFLVACEKIKRAGYIPITTDTAYGTSWVGYYLSRMMGTDAVNDLVRDGKLWDDPRVLASAKAIEELATKGYFDPNIASNQYPVAQQNMVINENIAFYINGTWLPNEVKDTTPADFKWGAFPFPSVPNGVDGTEAGCYSSYGIAVNKDTAMDVQQLAFEFAAFVTTGKWDKAFEERANAIPMGLSNDWPENLSAAKSALSNYTKRYPSQTALTTNNDSKQIISSACTLLMAGRIDAEEFVRQARNF